MKIYQFIVGLSILIFTSSHFVNAQALTAIDIINKADEKVKGKSSSSEIKMSIIRPKWTREISMKSWTLGDDYSLTLITGPAREKGTAFLKRSKEIWNFQPSIDRVIKLPPSMMMQSWMGSDFTNDDLVKQSSIVKDYTHSIAGNEEIDGIECYKIELIPKEDAPVVWGKVVSWISADHFIQLKTEFYDEDDYLVNTMLGKDVKELGGRMMASILEIIPADEPENRTVVEQLWIIFDDPIKESFFSVQNLKRIR